MREYYASSFSRDTALYGGGGRVPECMRNIEMVVLSSSRRIIPPRPHHQHSEWRTETVEPIPPYTSVVTVGRLSPQYSVSTRKTIIKARLARQFLSAYTAEESSSSWPVAAILLAPLLCPFPDSLRILHLGT